jgi:hypothetical protein
MKVGKSLVELATEIERQRETKKDYLVDTRATVMQDDATLKMGPQSYGIREVAHGQLATEAGIPKTYYDRMKVEAPQLLAKNVNHWLQAKPQKRMVRTLDGDVRAVLSDRYRPLDNADLAQVILPVMQQLDLEIVSSEITERRLYIKAVDKSVVQQLGEQGLELGKGHKHFKLHKVSPAVAVGNSEVGAGGLSVQGSVWEDGCTNLMIIKERSLRKYHVGGRQISDEDLTQLLSTEAKQAGDRAVWLQVRDVVKAAFDKAKFDAYCKTLVGATQDSIEGDPLKVIEVAQESFGWTDQERGSVLKHLIQNGELSRYGLMWAVTRAAEDVESYDRATDLERQGGEIIELPKADWQRIALAK